MVRVQTLPVVTMGMQPPSFLVIATPDIGTFGEFLSLARDFLACYSAVKTAQGLPFAEQNHPCLTCALFDTRGLPAQVVMTVDGNSGSIVLTTANGPRFLRNYLTDKGVSFRERLDHNDVILPNMTIDGLARKYQVEGRVNRKTKPMMEHVMGLVQMLDSQIERTSHEADLEATPGVASVVGNSIREVMCTELGCDLDRSEEVKNDMFDSFGTVFRCIDCGQHFTSSETVKIMERPPDPVVVQEEE